MTPDRPLRVGHVYLRREDQEAAIYDPQTGQLHRLNATALAIWELCDGSTEVSEMVSAVSELTGISLDHALSDISTTIEHLHRLGLLVTAQLEE